jgi:hypothetical protein
MLGINDTVDMNIVAEPATCSAERPSLTPTISPDGELLYKTLTSNFDVVSYFKSQLLDGETRQISFGWDTDLHSHFEILRQDFVGLPLLCFAHAQLIVCIRRKLNLTDDVPAFLKLWIMEHEFLTLHLNSRWLISACDTFVDHGSDAQKSIALVLIMLINTLKLAETERLMLSDTAPHPSKLSAIAEKRRSRIHIELWDGITDYALFSGDMPRNMIRRLLVQTEKDAALDAIAKTLIRRAVAADTVFGRLARLNEGFVPSELSIIG